MEEFIQSSVLAADGKVQLRVEISVCYPQNHAPKE
jgi:hypothetical protein